MNESAQPLRQPPVRMPKQDLGSFFAAEPRQPTDRSEGLAGLLAPLASPVVDSSPPIGHVIEDGTADQRTDAADSTSVGRPNVDEATALETPTAMANGVNETPDRAPSDDAPPASSGGRKKTYVYVRWPIRDRLKAFMEQSPDDLTHADVVRRALNRTHRQLSARFQRSPDEASDNLFSQAPARRRRRQQEPQVQVTMWLWEQHLAVIDRLVDEVGAPNRSALVDAALDLYLPDGSIDRH